MNLTKKIAATMFALLAMALMVTATASAQGRFRGRNYTKADVDRIIKRCEERSDAFTRMIDRNLDRSRLDGTRREDNINEQVRDLERALDELRREFDRRDTWRETRREVEKVMRESDEINALMKNARFDRNVEREWQLVKADLNKLAGIYEVRQLR
ncbi:MAG: hypothetical protein JNK38_15430 [Acidobacteria bacterium]|nr:hypothetical protein [Acidobacteriota bacterium]